jgi:hypothetical protein
MEEKAAGKAAFRLLLIYPQGISFTVEGRFVLFQGSSGRAFEYAAGSRKMSPMQRAVKMVGAGLIGQFLPPVRTVPGYGHKVSIGFPGHKDGLTLDDYEFAVVLKFAVTGAVEVGKRSSLRSCRPV